MNDSCIVKFLVDEFECHICFELLDEPRPACAWGHIFCKKTSRILEQLRRRVVRPPPHDIGIQTDPSSIRSIGQQTDATLPLDDTQGRDVESPEEEVEDIPSSQEDCRLSSSPEPSGYWGGVSLGYVPPPPETLEEHTLPMVCLQQNLILCREWDAMAAMAAIPRNDTEMVNEEHDTEPGAHEQVDKPLLVELAAIIRRLLKWTPSILRGIVCVVVLQIVHAFLPAVWSWMHNPSRAETLSGNSSIPSAAT
ncbi:hypothetical protein F4859DRAFT_518971 [Xylaria cf. heliscus]|nr:hypothetical protein F4859DRAFT_518971 [Xylaria cf. heliscus]